jgi:hypothetical protein
MKVETPFCNTDRAILSEAQGRDITAPRCGCCGVEVGMERRRHRCNKSHGWVETAWRCACRDAERCGMCGRCAEHCKCQ